MIVNRSAPSGTIVPSLIYTDVAKAIDWLCSVFGFKERLRAGGEDGKAGHAQLAIGQGGIILSAARVGQSADWNDSAELRPPRVNEVTQTLMVHVEDVDAHYERAKGRGARMLQPPTTHVFGERQYTAEDLEGHRWTFSQSVADVGPEDWGAKMADLTSRLALLPRPRFCYVEIPAVDLDQSVSFYEKVFGWNIRFRDSDRPSFDDATENISGAWVTGREASNKLGLLPYIWVDDINVTLAQVVANGGKVLQARDLDSAGGEWIATFHDPAGNLIGLYQEH
jgi:uncharacterized glyoxalase superfamily protein PhnB